MLTISKVSCTDGARLQTLLQNFRKLGKDEKGSTDETWSATGSCVKTQWILQKKAEEPESLQSAASGTVDAAAASSSSTPKAAEHKKKNKDSEQQGDWSKGVIQRIQERLDERKDAKKLKLSDRQDIPVSVRGQITFDDIVWVIAFLQCVANGKGKIIIESRTGICMQQQKQQALAKINEQHGLVYQCMHCMKLL